MADGGFSVCSASQAMAFTQMPAPGKGVEGAQQCGLTSGGCRRECTVECSKRGPPGHLVQCEAHCSCRSARRCLAPHVPEQPHPDRGKQRDLWALVWAWTVSGVSKSGGGVLVAPPLIVNCAMRHVVGRVEEVQGDV